MWQYMDEEQTFMFTWCVNCKMCGHWKNFQYAGHEWIFPKIFTQKKYLSERKKEQNGNSEMRSPAERATQLLVVVWSK